MGSADDFFKAPFTDQHEFYGHYCDYDWVVFCQLFGRMTDLPKGFPMYCRDLKQDQDRLGLTSDATRALLPDPKNEHNALADARWNKQLHGLLQGYEQVPPLLSERNELWEIQNMLNVPALNGLKGASQKVKALLDTVKKAAQGEHISNRTEDYQ